eukprot:1142609-Pelagomonas_calceolata.AAC.2
MGIWRVVDHTPEDPGGPDSTSPTLLCHKPSIPLFPPPKAPVNEDHVWCSVERANWWSTADPYHYVSRCQEEKMTLDLGNNGRRPKSASNLGSTTMCSLSVARTIKQGACSDAAASEAEAALQSIGYYEPADDLGFYGLDPLDPGSNLYRHAYKYLRTRGAQLRSLAKLHTCKLAHKLPPYMPAHTNCCSRFKLLQTRMQTPVRTQLAAATFPTVSLATLPRAVAILAMALAGACQVSAGRAGDSVARLFGRPLAARLWTCLYAATGSRESNCKRVHTACWLFKRAQFYIELHSQLAVGRLSMLTLLAVEGPKLQSFSYHLALFHVAGPVFCLYLSPPDSSQSELRGWVAVLANT